MRWYFVLILTIVCILVAGQPNPSSFLSQREPAMEKSLAQENRIPVTDLEVEVRSQKAHYVTIEFKSLPPDGIFKLNSSIRYGVGPRPCFIHIKVPGGDVTQLLAEPECRSITKTGKVPISCRELPADRKHQLSWTLKNFSPRDLKAIAPNIPAAWNRGIIELEPEDGIVDWAVIARFPSKVGWRFCHVKKWLNTDTADVTADVLIFYSGCVELPARFSVRRINLAREAEVSESVRQTLMNKAKKHVAPNEFSNSERFEF